MSSMLSQNEIEIIKREVYFSVLEDEEKFSFDKTNTSGESIYNTYLRSTNKFLDIHNSNEKWDVFMEYGKLYFINAITSLFILVKTKHDYTFGKRRKISEVVFDRILSISPFIKLRKKFGQNVDP